MASSVMEGHTRSCAAPNTCPATSRIGSPTRGSLSPPPGPMRGWCSSPISSADLASLSTHLSGDSCSTMPGLPRSGPELHPQHLGVYRRVRGFPLHPTPFRPMAQDFQCQAKGGARQPDGVQRRHGGQDAQSLMARGLLCVDPEGVAIGVVLHHRAVRP